MSTFIYAAELKKTFRCYGHFYRLNIEGCDPIFCRSMLEITSLPREAVGAGTDPDDLFCTNQISHTSLSVRNLPDAVVIMMNPGSSRPIEEGDTNSPLEMPLSDGFNKPLVLTQPDNTQYQLMRIMVSKGWNHIRILNISDIRDPKSPSFIARTKALDGIPNGDTHSLFIFHQYIFTLIINFKRIMRKPCQTYRCCAFFPIYGFTLGADIFTLFLNNVW